MNDKPDKPDPHKHTEEWCLHCEIHKAIVAQSEKTGEPVDYNDVIGALVQTMCEIACSADDPAEWGREICKIVMVEIPEACKEEIASRGSAETKH